MKFFNNHQKKNEKEIQQDSTINFPLEEEQRESVSFSRRNKGDGENAEQNSWTENLQGEFSQWIGGQKGSQTLKGDEFSDTMPQRRVSSMDDGKKRSQDSSQEFRETVRNGQEEFGQRRREGFSEEMMSRKPIYSSAESDREIFRKEDRQYRQENVNLPPVAEKVRTRDFPTVQAKNWQWAVAFVVSFSSLFLTPLFIEVFYIQNRYIAAGVMSGIALLGLLFLHPLLPLKLFRPLRKWDAFIVLGGAAATIFIAAAAANFFQKMGVVTAENPVIDYLAKENMLMLFITSWIQFIAEEIYFILPFLFVMEKTRALPRICRIILALLVSSLIFGGLHLSTYHYNFLQSFVIIGAVRTVLTLTYLWTKNLTVSYLAHGLYDWILIFIAYGAMHSGALFIL